MDELSMATTRIRLRLEDEPLANPPQKNILEEHNVMWNPVERRLFDDR